MFRISFCKILLVFCVFSYSIAAPHNEPLRDLFNDMISLFTGRSTATPSPQSGNHSRPGHTAARCAQRCMEQMRSCALVEIPGFEKQIWSFDYETSKLDAYCQIHENGSECLNTCPESVAKSLATNGLSIGRQICNSSGIRKHAVCIKEAVESLRADCNSQTQCGRYPFPESQQIRSSSVEELQRLMRQTCLRLKCNLECTSATIIQRCGQSAEQDIELLVQTAARYLKDLSSSIKAPQAYAAECDLLENLSNSTIFKESEIGS